MLELPLLCAEYTNPFDFGTCLIGHYAVVGEAGLAGLILFFLLSGRHWVANLGWFVAAALMGIFSLILDVAGSALYFLPPVGHTGPVTPGTPNSFPSHHALLAATIVAAVLLASPVWAIPIAVLALVIDWALIAVGTHHVADVLGSDAFVAISTLLAVLLAPTVTRRLTPIIGRDPRLRRLDPGERDGRGVDRMA